MRSHNGHVFIRRSIETTNNGKYHCMPRYIKASHSSLPPPLLRSQYFLPTQHTTTTTVMFRQTSIRLASTATPARAVLVSYTSQSRRRSRTNWVASDPRLPSDLLNPDTMASDLYDVLMPLMFLPLHNLREATVVAMAQCSWSSQPSLVLVREAIII